MLNIKPTPKLMDPLVYILQLEGDNYYVGLTTQRGYPWRTQAHFNREGSAWTRLHKPLKVLETKPGGKDIEREETLRMMRQHGWEKVRGAAWTACNLRLPPVALREASPFACQQVSCEAWEVPQQEPAERLVPDEAEASVCL